MKIYLIRHGQTNRNIEANEYIGQPEEEPLTELGRKQASLLGERLKKENLTFKEIYCSPYSRAKETCEIACSKFTEQKPTYIDALREYSTGKATSKKREEIITFDLLNKMSELGMHFSYEDGESLFQVQRRVCDWFYGVMEQYKNTNEKIAIFSHGMTIKCLIQYIMGFDHRLTWRLSLDNTAISLFDYKFGHWFVKNINDTKHLNGFEQHIQEVLL